MFVDYAEVQLTGGTGGSGCMAFHREKYVPQGGPSGGDGGNGGNIYFQANENLSTLMDFSYKRLYKAKRGEHGKGSHMHGKNAEDICIDVPLGTIVKRMDTNEILADFTTHGQKLLIAKGGRGGRGNAHFATASNRIPKKWEYGREGESFTVSLEVKLFADIGLVGYPNAGKSTLLSVLSGAKPKIADYPFTTLEPKLGIISHHNDSFVMADIPGIIDGAAEGKGLGHQFLRHIERTKSIAYIIDSCDEHLEDSYRTLKSELSKYSKLLLEKPSIVIFTKSDLIETELLELDFAKGLDYIIISAVQHNNLDNLREKLYQQVLKGREIYDDEAEEKSAKNEFDF
ncbi:MAG: GTPase ObgE [Calditrichaeota bacterium]|nr:GTPase ObgE [Calditrichota bacterium]